MKPLHGEVTRLKRCPCCQGKYSRAGMKGKKNNGKSAARQAAKRAIMKEE